MTNIKKKDVDNKIIVNACIQKTTSEYIGKKILEIQIIIIISFLKFNFFKIIQKKIELIK